MLKLLKIIIELDGPQHFIQIMNWKSPEETRKGDIYKMKCAGEQKCIVRKARISFYNV